HAGVAAPVLDGVHLVRDGQEVHVTGAGVAQVDLDAGAFDGGGDVGDAFGQQLGVDGSRRLPVAPVAVRQEPLGPALPVQHLHAQPEHEHVRVPADLGQVGAQPGPA